MWQRTALHHPAVRAPFADKSLFEALRVDPFHRVIRRVHPDLAAVIDESIDELAQAGLTLVHGDFSPKNVLVPASTGREPWVIDFEVVHVGHPVFDVAFLSSHLILKSIHLPAPAGARSTRTRPPSSPVTKPNRRPAAERCDGVARTPHRVPAARPRRREVAGDIPHRRRTRDGAGLAVDVLASADPEAAFAELTGSKEPAP